MSLKSIANEAYQQSPTNKDGNKELYDIAFLAYKNYVSSLFPQMATYWPVVAGTHYKIGTFENYFVIILIDQGPTSFIQRVEIGDINLNLKGNDRRNPKMIRKELFSLLNLKKRDAIFLFDTSNSCENWINDLERDLEENLLQHKVIMNMQPMKIFLSHKSINKDKVRNFKNTLDLLGFSPWLDEDAMSAGVNLERALMEGMSDSCAAIFFITPDYKDENYLATEIDYAISRKREDENFSIIALVFTNENGDKGIVPKMLKKYVWKEPDNDLAALNEILKALPLEVGEIHFK